MGTPFDEMKLTTAGVSSTLAAYLAIRALARQQKQIVSEGNLEGFHEILLKRERLISSLAGAGRLSSDERERVQQIAQEILAIDHQTQQLLSTALEETAGELSSLHQKNTAIGGYRSRQPRTSRALDING